eukprot:TRINITY_DN6048_c0_g1_i1.p1 TRINITY_DN6048_c0_g1~~TRINITY_DN6048_c0_g1_i1.p1  ORF type:complete len:233 (-),score=39.50 TRINITY_DN6048_c0_g1_i1:98-796(-)
MFGVRQSGDTLSFLAPRNCFVYLGIVRVRVVVRRWLTRSSVNKDRITACNWYVDKVMSTWEQYDPQRVQNIGFYWFYEEIPDTDDEHTLLRSLADHIHSFGQEYGFQWIPYFGASGRDIAYDLGFDAVTYQPNYAFNNATIDRFYDVVTDACKLHIGIEMELPLDCTNPNVNWQQNFNNYLTAASVYRFQTDSLLSFYYGNDFVSMGTTPTTYSYYQQLYWLVRGSYPNPPN